MQELSLEGDYYEIGHQYGQILDDVGFQPPEPSPATLEFVNACEPMVREHTPELVEELEGIADAGEWEHDHIRAIPLGLGYEAGCSVVAISGVHTDHGRPILGRNYDFYQSFAEYTELFRTDPAGRQASVGCSDHWVGRHDGLNESGLAIGHTFVPNDGFQPGVMFSLAARWVLDTCTTVSAAVKFLGSIPHARNTNFLIADAAGEIATVEASPHGVTTSEVSGGIGVITNHFVSDSMQAFEPADADHEWSERRMDNLHAWFSEAQPTITLEVLQDVMADPVDGVCTCGEPDDTDPVDTLWSWTIDLGLTEPYLADGRPNTIPFESVEL